MQRSPLPPALGVAFTVAEAVKLGVPRSRLRAHDLTSPYRGVRSLSDASRPRDAGPLVIQLAEEVRDRARQYGLIMPENQLLTHLTAAICYRLPVPGHLLMTSAGRFSHASQLDVGVFAPARTPRASGIRGHQLVPTHASVWQADGLRLTSPASTWSMLGSVVEDLRDIVAIGDAVVREPMFSGDRPALATLAQLEAAVRAGRRVGIGRLREALPLIRTRSASRRETWCRLTIMDARLPEPELNWDVRDANGQVVACVDLAYPGLKIAIEYEGEHHLTDARQWAKDIERHARLVELGWVVIRVTKHQLVEAQHEFTARVRRAMAARS